jgi:hypothetical protein
MQLALLAAPHSAGLVLPEATVAARAQMAGPANPMAVAIDTMNVPKTPIPSLSG